LDEIGELDALVQVKLLRVLQTGTFQRLGTTESLTFRGKIVAATHCNLHRAMEQQKFRPDFYYRLCSDVITTPSLQQQVSETPEVLGDLIAYISQKVAGPEDAALAAEVQSWIQTQLGRDYPWPGNIRELEQCVRNIMIRREYRPATELVYGQYDRQAVSLLEGKLSLEELCRLYCRRVYDRVGSYADTARRLKIDRRTVKKYVDEKP
jgi:transcriptional regulator with PAS, ATPase and Fis domain